MAAVSAAVSMCVGAVLLSLIIMVFSISIAHVARRWAGRWDRVL